MRPSFGIVTVLASLLASPLILPTASYAGDLTVVGSGIVCNTSDQVARLTTLLDHDPAEAAVEIVNRESSDPKACGLAVFAFQAGKKVADVHNAKGAFEIVEIRILAAHMQDGWHIVSPQQTQYTIVPVKGFDI